MTADQTLAELQSTGRRLRDLLLSVADRQDWRPGPGEWSFREIAAHLEATQRECVLVRVMAIASGTNPLFEYYDNTGRDFGRVELKASLRGFTEARRAVHDFVRGLSPEQRHLTGRHASFGQVTVDDYLKLDLEHDQGHLRDLQRWLED